MSTEMELTIYARGERAEDALKAIEADKQWKDTGYDANGEVVTAYTDLLPAEWRPLLQYIATRYDVLLEVYTELTSPDAWEIGEGLDTYAIGYFGSSLSARIPFWHPDKQIAFWQRAVDQCRAIRDDPKTEKSRGSGLTDQIHEYEGKIADLRSRRAEIAKSLLAHRATYFDKLTPKAQTYILKDNESLQAIVDLAKR